MSSYPAHKERRRDPRVSLSLLAKLYLSSGNLPSSAETIEAETENLSRSGVYCRLRRELPEYTKLDIVLELPLKGEKYVLVQCQGIVVRSLRGKEGNFYAAIFFSRMDDLDRYTLEKYITQRIKEMKLSSVVSHIYPV